jgi:hypothetical protein
MRTDDYHYRLNQFQRDAVIRAANRRRLIHKALENRPKTKRAYAVALLTLWHSLFR